jgi:hypothetical protein
MMLFLLAPAACIKVNFDSDVKPSQQENPPPDGEIQPLRPPPGPTTTTMPTNMPRSVVTEKSVTPLDHQLDVQLVIDNSNSMLVDNQKLANRLQGFVHDLSAAGFDWQMCVTVTSAQQLSSQDPQLYWGASRFWAGVSTSPAWILKPGQTQIFEIFQNTINEIGAGWAGTDDERGIKAAWWHLWNGDVRYPESSGCYRKDAGLATLIISDEDERSVGGRSEDQFYPDEYQPLYQDDEPNSYINLVK